MIAIVRKSALNWKVKPGRAAAPRLRVIECIGHRYVYVYGNDYRRGGAALCAAQYSLRLRAKPKFHHRERSDQRDQIRIRASMTITNL